MQQALYEIKYFDKINAYCYKYIVLYVLIQFMHSVEFHLNDAI